MMENTLPNGAKLLIVKNKILQEVTAFVGFPIDLEDFVAVNKSEEDFIKNNQRGFIIYDVSTQGVKIKFLNCDINELNIDLGKQENIILNGESTEIKLIAVRVGATSPSMWQVA